MKKSKRMMVGILCTVTLLVLTGCSKTAPAATANSTVSPTQESLTKEEGRDPLGSLSVTLQDAIGLYQETYPNTDITSIELDGTLKTWFYTIEGVDDTREFELRINASTKEFDTKREESLDKEDTNGQKRKQNKLNIEGLASMEEITNVAQGAVGKGSVTDWELAKELDITYWKVTIKEGNKESEVKVNAQTKAILETDLEE